MELKRIENLKEGDILLRNSTKEKYPIKDILVSSDEETNYGFFGFYVRKKIMDKFFKSGQTGIFVYND